MSNSLWSMVAGEPQFADSPDTVVAQLRNGKLILFFFIVVCYCLSVILLDYLFFNSCLSMLYVGCLTVVRLLFAIASRLATDGDSTHAALLALRKYADAHPDALRVSLPFDHSALSFISFGVFFFVGASEASAVCLTLLQRRRSALPCRWWLVCWPGTARRPTRCARHKQPCLRLYRAANHIGTLHCPLRANKPHPIALHAHSAEKVGSARFTNGELLVADGPAIRAVLAHTQSPDYYVRFGTTQLLAALLSSHPDRVQRAIAHDWFVCFNFVFLLLFTLLGVQFCFLVEKVRPVP